VKEQLNPLEQLKIAPDVFSFHVAETF